MKSKKQPSKRKNGASGSLRLGSAKGYLKYIATAIRRLSCLCPSAAFEKLLGLPGIFVPVFFHFV